MQVLLNCTHKPSFSKKKSVFMGEAPAAQAAPAAQKPEVQPAVTQPTVPQAPVQPQKVEGVVLPKQPTQDVFVKKTDCKDCK